MEVPFLLPLCLTHRTWDRASSWYFEWWESLLKFFYLVWSPSTLLVRARSWLCDFLGSFVADGNSLAWWFPLVILPKWSFLWLVLLHADVPCWSCQKWFLLRLWFSCLLISYNDHVKMAPFAYGSLGLFILVDFDYWYHSFICYCHVTKMRTNIESLVYFLFVNDACLGLLLEEMNSLLWFSFLDDVSILSWIMLIRLN